MADQSTQPSSVSSTLLRWGVLAGVLTAAVVIRLHAVFEYGRVIHEFDPWFNYRAAEYLEANGLSKFLTWFDDKVWYPLGRPVGTTIYPAMQVTAVAIYRVFQALGWGVTLNDVCVFIPAGFGAIASFFIYLLAKEVTGSGNSGLAAAAIFAIIPAHLMRSVAGGYDNESVAVSAICGTFFLWVRSLRTPGSYPWAVLAGLMYFYMAAAWGAYTFVLNMVAMHAFFLLVLGRYTDTLHKAYTLFYVVGTLGALQVPVVGLAPLQSLEQLSALGVFALVWAAWFVQRAAAAHGPAAPQVQRAKMMALGALAAGGVAFLVLLSVTGRLGAVTTRVKSLFIPHTKTGNPLVDSVAEHQATANTVYFQYFHVVCYLAPIGFFATLAGNFKYRGDAKVFLVCYTVASAYFSRKMIRLVLLLAPAASVTAGIAVTLIFEWCFAALFGGAKDAGKEAAVEAAADAADAVDAKKEAKEESNKKKGPPTAQSFVGELTGFVDKVPALKTSIAVALLVAFSMGLSGFWAHSWMMSEHLSSPQIMLKGRNRDGSAVMIDDFRQAYWWLRDNTPEDSRIMSWWDYGYQINGVANRTTIADGNTWNHEHIALLGRALISDIKVSHKEITRHIADYVLIWATRHGGMWGDDLAKCPHMCRISNSVYNTVDLRNCQMDQSGNPSPQMRKTLLYTLHSHGFDPAVPKPKNFEEVYMSPNRMVRIWKVLKVDKESKAHPFGTYPPALAPILAQKKDFKSPH